VYVSHGTEVDVVDTKTGAVAGKITGLHGVHGIALAPEFGHGFISNGQSGTITIFDLKSLDKIGEDVAAGKNPDAIIYDPGSKRVFAFNGRSSDATAIDAKKLTVEHRWSLAPCEEPSGMAMDTKSRRLFAGCHNKMVAVMNADTGKVVATPAIGDGVDATAFDPETKYVFNSCGDGTLSIAHEDSPDKYTVVEQVKTIQRARTMALDSKTHNVYLAIADFEPAPAPATPPAGDKGGDKGSDKAPQRPRMRVVPDTFGLLEYGR
jgi:DNA-binding beta-propeller fold protein YncE